MIKMRRTRAPIRPLLGAGLCVALAFACSSDDGGDDEAGGGTGGAAGGDAAPQDVAEDAETGSDAGLDVGVGDGPDASLDAGPCPADMVFVDGFCIDRYEAPNREGELPLVMYTFDESEAWCAARGKRLCFDDEWTRSCAGTAGNKYPYGNTLLPGTCNDEEVWKAYDQNKLNGWPWNVSKPGIESLKELLDAVRAVSSGAATAADHVEALYQGEPGGANAGCVGEDAVFDLCGNVEEWTRRRDGGNGPDFSGALKGRYWAESRTCQNAVTNHGNGFRFYEIGFRCCRDVQASE